MPASSASSLSSNASLLVAARLSVALENKHQLGKQQPGHIIGLHIAAATLVLQLGNHLPVLGHAAAANPPVRNPGEGVPNWPGMCAAQSKLSRSRSGQ